MLYKLTPKAREVLRNAQSIACRLHHHYIGTNHLFLALLEDRQGLATHILRQFALPIDDLYDACMRHVMAQTKHWVPIASNANASFMVTPRLLKVLALAQKKSSEWQHAYIGTEHLLFALLSEGHGLSAQLLQSLNIDANDFRNALLDAMRPSEQSDETREEDDENENEGDDEAATNEDNPEDDDLFFIRKHATASPLKMFGQDLTQKALRNELDPVIGRDKEIDRLIQILCRRTKNNPVLIGEAGVGKTALVEGLAQRIANHQVPDLLIDKVIVDLDLALLLSGTKYRGQFEERLKGLMREAQSANIILFLDELHTIVGAGSAEGSIDASNILKPALARGKLQCIGATTLNEYRMHIEKDSALSRRFQPVLVEQPSVEETLKILRGLKERYEQFHKVHYPEAVLKKSVQLAHRYVPNRYFPDKAIDLLDEAGARTHILNMDVAPSTETLDQEIRFAKDKKTDAIRHQQFEEAARWRDKEQTLRDKRFQVLDTWKEKTLKQTANVKEATLQKIMFDWTGIPVEQMETHERQHYLHLETTLNRLMIGQKEAVKTIAQALKRSRTDLKDPRCPIGSFLFLGPTGVGKTYLVKLLAEQIFGSRDAIIQVDMSEYMEKYMVSRLIGSPPGYVGHENGGQLTEKVRRKPYSIVLLDEIEKAHPDVLQILLQVLDEGHLTDTFGRRVDFKNTIIVMTSNVGAQALQHGIGLGFGAQSEAMAFEQMKSAAHDAAKRAFKPEFLNRIDDIVIFHPLNRKHILSIVDLEMKPVQQRLKAKGITLKLEATAKQFLADKGFDEKMGVRPLKRAIERYVENPLADGLLMNVIKPKQTVSLYVHASQQKLAYRIIASAPRHSIKAS